MSTEPTTTRRTLTGLPQRSTIADDPSISRLRREHRQPPATPTSDAVQHPPHQQAEPASPGTGEEAPAQGLPRYLQLIRKEARVRQDQADRLAQEVRRLNQARRTRGGMVGERITDNTLIRVAVDLLLEHPERLHGVTEQALRESVSRWLRLDWSGDARAGDGGLLQAWHSHERWRLCGPYDKQGDPAGMWFVTLVQPLTSALIAEAHGRQP